MNYITEKVLSGIAKTSEKVAGTGKLPLSWVWHYMPPKPESMQKQDNEGTKD